jgi:hypothetical protein
MWLFTKFGFFSVEKKESDRKDKLTPRARANRDLEVLIKSYLPSTNLKNLLPMVNILPKTERQA